MDLKSLLLKQYELYPKVQIQDMVKLIYQNEFAGGHLITDENDSLRRLREEYASLKEYPPNSTIPAENAFEDIGNGMCRLHLQPLHNIDISLATINKFFVSTANSTSGSIRGFEKKLGILKQCCKDRALPYPLEELEAYLNSYRSRGYPPVRHSEEYRAAYSPAYRVVKSEYGFYFELFRRIDSLLKSKDTVNVAIDGNCCAGKSTLASLLGSVYDCNIFHMDHFFLRPELKTEERMKEAGGNADYARFKKEVIAGLKSGSEFRYQKYDCSQGLLTGYITVLPKQLNIIEGVYCMHPSLADSYNLKVFLHIDEEKQSMRIKKRNGELMYKKFLSEWVPKENQYFSQMKIPEQCDLIFPPTLQ